MQVRAHQCGAYCGLNQSAMQTAQGYATMSSPAFTTPCISFLAAKIEAEAPGNYPGPSEDAIPASAFRVTNHGERHAAIPSSNSNRSRNRMPRESPSSTINTFDT